MTVKSADNQDFLCVYLAHSTTLSGCEQGLTIYYEWRPFLGEGPSQIKGVYLQTLYCVKILFGIIGDPAEHVHEFLLKRAASMIVTASVHLCEHVPLVVHSVINLSLLARTVNVLPGARYDDKILADRAACVTVTRILHPCPLF